MTEALTAAVDVPVAPPTPDLSPDPVSDLVDALARLGEVAERYKKPLVDDRVRQKIGTRVQVLSAGVGDLRRRAENLTRLASEAERLIEVTVANLATLDGIGSRAAVLIADAGDLPLSSLRHEVKQRQATIDDAVKLGREGSVLVGRAADEVDAVATELRALITARVPTPGVTNQANEVATKVRHAQVAAHALAASLRGGR